MEHTFARLVAAADLELTPGELERTPGEPAFVSSSSTAVAFVPEPARELTGGASVFITLL